MEIYNPGKIVLENTQKHEIITVIYLQSPSILAEMVKYKFVLESSTQEWGGAKCVQNEFF